jgi:hypothetical protein
MTDFDLGTFLAMPRMLGLAAGPDRRLVAATAAS